jgi:hypothetical protein
MTMPRYSQIIFVIGLVLTGVIAGQVIRRVRGLADEFARRIEQSRGGAL